MSADPWSLVRRYCTKGSKPPLSLAVQPYVIKYVICRCLPRLDCDKVYVSPWVSFDIYLGWDSVTFNCDWGFQYDLYVEVCFEDRQGCMVVKMPIREAFDWVHKIRSSNVEERYEEFDAFAEHIKSLWY